MNGDFIRGRQTRFDAPPKLVPAGGVDVSGGGRWRVWEGAGTAIDAPILGNGDMLAAFAGPPRWPQFWLTTNDFWQMQSNPNYVFFHDNAVARRDPPVSLGSPRPLGRIVFDIPALEGASYEVVQTFEDGTTRARFTRADGASLRMDSWVAAGENALVVEFCGDIDCEIALEFYFPNETGKGCDRGVDCMGDCEDDAVLSGTYAGLVGGKPMQVRNDRNGLLWGWRAFADGQVHEQGAVQRPAADVDGADGRSDAAHGVALQVDHDAYLVFGRLAALRRALRVARGEVDLGPDDGGRRDARSVREDRPVQ